MIELTILFIDLEGAHCAEIKKDIQKLFFVWCFVASFSVLFVCVHERIFGVLEMGSDTFSEHLSPGELI